MESPKKKVNPIDILKEIVNDSFEIKRGRKIHKKELESYVCDYYYNETKKEIKCSKNELYNLMNNKYGKQNKGYWKDIKFKYFE